MRNFWHSFRTALVLAGSVLAASLVVSAPAAASESKLVPPSQQWSWTGLFGSYDRASAQRGLKVYAEVCAACHSLQLLSYRNLTDLGFSEEQVKAFAANYEVQDGPNDDGEYFTRPARPSDRFVKPFPNEKAARAANGGALPVDLSLIIDNRAHGKGSIAANFIDMISVKGSASGADYVYALLNGYGEAPADVAVADGQYYNEWFNGHLISMPPPLSEGGVEFSDGTEASVEQMAHDVVTFLAWASEPNLEQSKRIGLMVLLFLIVAGGIVVAAKRRIWANVH